MVPLPDELLRIVLVEDSQAIVERIGELLDDIPGVVMGGIARTASEAVLLIASAKPHVVLLDVFLQDGSSGIDVLKAARHSGADFIVMTNQPSPELKHSAISLGASFFLDKTTNFFDIASAIRELRAGRKMSSAAAAAH